MTTGYTEKIKDGITFREYALNCSKAFGALYHMRDEVMNAPIVIEDIKPSNYHLNRAKEATENLREFEKITDDEWDEETEIQHKKDVKYFTKTLRKKIDLKTKYDEMLKQIELYKSPSPDHDEFKTFMASQILESIKHDCSLDYMTYPEKMNAKEYRKEMIESYTDSLKYWKKQYKKEVERCKEKREWVETFLNSLPKK